MASLDMIAKELEFSKKLATKSHVEYRMFKNIKYKCEDGQVRPIAYPTNTSSFVIPLHTVGVLAFVLYYLEMPNFFQNWAVYFSREISDEHFYMLPFHKCEKVIREKHYKYNWRKNMKNRLKDDDFWLLCDQFFKSNDHQEHALENSMR